MSSERLKADLARFRLLHAERLAATGVSAVRLLLQPGRGTPRASTPAAGPFSAEAPEPWR